MTKQKQTKPLRLARELEGVYPVNIQDQEAAAAELRRLHAENEALRKCAVKYLTWLNIRDPKKSLEGDLTDPEMLA